MAIEDTKRWHWIIVGLVAGLALSYAWTSMDPPAIAKSTKALGFENELFKPPLKGGQPNVTDIVVYPSVGGLYPVTFKLRTPTRDSKGWTYEPWSFVAETPFRASNNRAPTTQAAQRETILTYLARVSASNKNIKYTYAWWRTRNWTYVLWTGGAVLLIGGVWPTLLNLLVGAGFGRVRGPKDDYDLSRFGKGSRDENPVAGKAIGLTDEDRRKLEEIESKIGGALGLEADPKPQPSPKNAPAEVRKLEAGPLQAKLQPKTPEEEKEYRGEYYPTARAKKKE